MNLVGDIFLPGEIGNQGRRHHHGNGIGEEVNEIQDMEAINMKPCKLQKEMHRDPIGTKFLALFEHLCKKGTDPNMVGIIFGNPNLNAEQVNLGVNDHLYATTILKKMKPEEREVLYKLAETFIDEGKDFKFDKQHNMFQEMHNKEKNFKDLLSFNFGGMMMENLTYNLPRPSFGFANNLLVGEHFDNITNIKLQSYHGMFSGNNPNIGFYIYVGENEENVKKYFIDCEHESGKSFKITKVKSQDGGFLGFFNGDEGIPDKDVHGSYFQGLKDEFEVDGKKIFIAKDPFSDDDDCEKEELKQEEQPRTSKGDDETEPVIEPVNPGPVPVTESGPESGPVTTEPVTESGPVSGGKRKTKKRKNKTKKRKGKTKKRKTTYKKRKTKKN